MTVGLLTISNVKYPFHEISVTLKYNVLGSPEVKLTGYFDIFVDDYTRQIIKTDIRPYANWLSPLVEYLQSSNLTIKIFAVKCVKTKILKKRPADVKMRMFFEAEGVTLYVSPGR